MVEEEQKTTAVSGSSEEEIDLLHALKTAFSDKGNVELFLAEAATHIRRVEGTIIDTCAKNRTRIDDNLYSLLESRDAIAEHAAELAKAGDTASDVDARVDAARRDVVRRRVVRANLDAALSVAARTRRLTRMYARIDATMQSQRLHVALRMLRVLDDEIRDVRRDSVLLRLLPDTRRLRAQLVVRARRAARAWLRDVRAAELQVGWYALAHARMQAVSRQLLLDVPRGALGEPFALLPMLAAAPARRPPARPWTPLLADRAQRAHHACASCASQAGDSRPVFPEPASAATIAATTLTVDGGGAEGMAGVEAPKLVLQPLLQALHVSEGLHLLADLRSEYRKERLAHLQNVLHARDDVHPVCDTCSAQRTDVYGDVYGNVDVDLELDLDAQPEADEAEHGDHVDGDNVGDNDGDGDGNEWAAREDTDGDGGASEAVGGKTMDEGEWRADRIERIVFQVAGFFVVERTVEMHAMFNMVTRDVVDDEWWCLAYAKLLGMFKEHEENSWQASSEKTRVRRVEENLERFAELNGLIK